MQKIVTWVAHHKKILHQKLTPILTLIPSRERLILFTVVFGIFMRWVVYLNEYNFKVHYSAGILLDFALVVVCYLAIRATISFRILGLCFFISVDAGMNILSIINTDMYWSLLDFRYEKGIYGINFQIAYQIYEILCLVISLWIITDPHRKTNSNGLGRGYRGDSHIHLRHNARDKKT